MVRVYVRQSFTGTLEEKDGKSSKAEPIIPSGHKDPEAIIPPKGLAD